ncbi:energy-coupling factor ABC transporter ATP-binding protein [Comamonas sp. NLF-1-9]|uniref:energy-coupling factor ABC transporter ATP-binding protein n=1 Tax=Comamonas sp. NLF-1-9 TaxID=2853163 RepID=UPI001C487C0C|nr:ABC transporter ATP-binding protein [Comamonas sp. NLF-1-9]QXL83258.1 energy-coupling factor ABC transporter ATP-binding protein [Comamonas sp. NLF-1-9]
MTAPSPGWRLRDIGLRRGQRTIFQNLNLDLDEARIALIGHNGAGKSSLLRLLVGLDTPQQGSLSWAGQTAHAARRTHTLGGGRLASLMFQNPDDQIIFPTVAEELQLSWSSAHGGDRKAARRGALQFLEQRGLLHWADRAMGTLSQGERQSVCWLAMLLAKPRVLLLDEPYASLDLPGQLRLEADVGRCAQQVIVSTHVLHPVRDFGRVIWLEDGRVRADGPGLEICAAYEAQARRQFADTAGAA